MMLQAIQHLCARKDIRQDARRCLMTDSEDFCKVMESDEYVYADEHIVKNGERYVRQVEERKEGTRLLLTDWANRHVDECCLRFVRVYLQTGIVVVDEASFDPEIGKLLEYVRCNASNCVIYAPESYEFLLLHAGLFEVPEGILNKTYLFRRQQAVHELGRVFYLLPFGYNP